MNRSTAAVLATVLTCLLVTVALPLSFPSAGPTGFDRSADDRLHAALDGHHGVYRVLVTPSDPWVVLPILLAAALWYLRSDRWRAGFLVVAPELAVLVNTAALKPMWHRHLKDYLAYPSGHTVQFVAVATALVLVAATRRVRAILATLSVVLLAAVAVGMVGVGYHYPTDILGGTATAVGLVTAQWATVRGRFAANPPAGFSARRP
ncbi:phosphatase PAP2 family protein [Nocardia stercoris]|uniref:Phosphatase PAP2 family protein n=1 Tax=Nocardia stercoris TaxID=2483361 RepID=A0A3M2L3T0_9NOCA|nr:phosphatase PAP2 family protein [Nocardia stercoris]RMI32201.1 phosphatase PAP2 family protein [Nocardia stercoris]